MIATLAILAFLSEAPPARAVASPQTVAKLSYDRALYLATRAFYGQRCGTAVDLGGGYKYPACHRQGAFHPSSGNQGPRPNGGGWHDAGDYGRYVVNSAITVGTLMWAWEMFPDVFGRLKLDIPESTNATPDLLDEVRWNLEWMLSMQDVDGGVWHKQTSEAFPALALRPEADETISYVIGTGAAPFKSSCATAGLAATAAIAARVYRPHDAAFADRALLASRKSWAWVTAHPNITFRNPAGVTTGEYGDADCRDEILWAAAEIWRTTGDAEAHDYFLRNRDEAVHSIRADSPPDWSELGPFAAWTYALARNGDAVTTKAIRSRAIDSADAIIARISAHRWRIPLTEADFVWGSNGVAANYGVQLLVANALSPDGRLVAAADDIVQYLLGRNAFGVSWLTGIGNSFRNPHHRPSAGDDLAEPWPGLLSGGPNAKRQDAVLKKLPAGTPPEKMWVDDVEAYSANEIAINWNAPLVFVLAGIRHVGER